MNPREEILKLNIIQLKQRINLLEIKSLVIKDKDLSEINNKLEANRTELKQYGVEI